jgi:hypothetical protein
VISQAADGSHVVIAAFARPGSTIDVRLNGRFVRRVRVGSTFWADIALPAARPGDVVFLAGVGDHHFSHSITVGRTPGGEVVHGE